MESTWESLWTSGSPARGVARVRAPWEGLGQRDSWRVGSQQRGGRPRSGAILLEKGGNRGGEGDFRPAGGLWPWTGPVLGDPLSKSKPGGGPGRKVPTHFPP